MERRVLLVEDDTNFRKVFARLMREALAPERLDVALVEAGTLAEARTRLREGGLDAALIDVTLPDGNGLELVGEINNGGVGDRPHPDPRVDGKPGGLCGWQGDGGGREGSVLQAGFDARDRGMR
jgi:DNA-binding LytR/AlgR family response regulator